MRPIIHNGRIAIIGAGDLGQQIAHLAKLNGEQVVGFFDDVQTGNLGKVSDILSSNCYDTLLMGIGYKHFQARQDIFERLKQAGVKFATLIDSSCWIDPTAVIGEGCVISPMCHIGQEAVVEPNVLLNPAVHLAHNSHVGAHSFFGGHANVAGFATVGKRCFVGVGAIVIDNLAICDDVLLGAGSVVVKPITAPATYVGNPAHRIDK